MNNFDDYFDNDQDGRFVQFIKKFGTSFILTVSALLSISFYVTAGSAVFGWMPQEWMITLSAIILGLTGNELAVSFWLSVRSRAKNVTETQATVIGAGIAAGAVTSTLTTLASFIVTPETSPEFLAAYADVIAFTMMSIPVIIQTICVMLFLAYTREAEVATSKAKTWGEDLKNTIIIGSAMSKATAHEKQQEIRRQLPAYSQQVGQHGARKLVDRGLSAVRAEQEGSGGFPTEPETIALSAQANPASPTFTPTPAYKPSTYLYETDGNVIEYGIRDEVDVQRRAERYCKANNVIVRVLLETPHGSLLKMTYKPDNQNGSPDPLT